MNQTKIRKQTAINKIMKILFDLEKDTGKRLEDIGINKGTFEDGQYFYYLWIKLDE